MSAKVRTDVTNRVPCVHSVKTGTLHFRTNDPRKPFKEKRILFLVFFSSREKIEIYNRDLSEIGRMMSDYKLSRNS